MTERVNILHVEDLAEDAELVARSLKNLVFNHDITVVSNREDFLQVLLQNPPDIILSDHSMPGFNSIEALTIVKNLALKIPLILVTATVSEEFAVSIIKKGASDYILKERMSRLCLAIESALENSKLEKEKQAAEQKFKALVEHSENMLVLFAANMQITYASLALKKTLESIDTVIPISFTDIIYPNDITLMNGQLEEVFQRPGMPVASLVRLITHRGEVVWAEGTLTNMLQVPGINSVVANFRNVTAEKETEAALEQTEERYRRIVETAQEGIWAIDEHKKTVFVNDKLCEILEYAPDELMGLSPAALMAEEDVAGGMAAMERWRKGAKETVELRYLTKTRRYIWANVSASPVTDDHGENKGVLAMITDITQRKLAEEALIRNEALMRAILENCQDAIGLFDARGAILYESPAVAKISGYSPSELVGRNRSDFFHPDEVAKAAEFFEEVLREPGVQKHFRRRLRHKNGHYIWSEGTMVNLLNDPKVNGIVTNFRDVSERINAENALKESEYKFRSLIQHSTDAITVINADEDIVFASDSLYKITGFTIAELMNEPSRQYVHPLDMPAVHEVFRYLINNPGATKNVSYRRLKKDGSYFWCEAVATNLLNEPAVGGIVINFRDITERKEAELRLQESHAALQRSEANLAAIIENTDAYIYSLDRELRYVFFNLPLKKSIKENYGIDIEQGEKILGVLEQTDPEEAKAWEKVYTTALAGKNMQFVKDYSKNGNPRYLTFSINPIWENDEVVGLSCFASNVTEQKQSEEKVLHTEHLLTEAQQLAKMGNWNVDVIRKETYWSRGTRALFGVVDSFSPGLDSLNSMVHPDDRERVINELVAAGKSGQTLEQQYRIIRKDGNTRILNAQTHFIHDTKGNALRTYGILQDVTDMKKAEETVRRSEANLNTIFNNGDTIYILIDCNFTIVSFNELARQYAIDELTAPLCEGNNLLDSIEQEKRNAVNESITALLNNNDSIETEYAISGNSSKSYYTRYFPVSNKEQEVFGIIIAINDITERKLEELKTLKLLELVQKKNKDLGQFAYIVSHNLRSPIAKILGLVSLFETNAANEIPDKALIEYIANEANNLDNVVKDLNTIITARDIGPEVHEYVNFEDLLKLILSALDTEIKEADAIVSYYFPEAAMYTVRSYMYSIMFNLISNAIKYRSPKQQLSIYIQTKRENDRLSLSIADNGLGIDMSKNKRKIFGLYRRFHGDTIPGKGIGLYIVKTQTETLGGTIDVKSEINEGTTFKISIPI